MLFFFSLGFHMQMSLRCVLVFYLSHNDQSPPLTQGRLLQDIPSPAVRRKISIILFTSIARIVAKASIWIRTTISFLRWRECPGCIDLGRTAQTNSKLLQPTKAFALSRCLGEGSVEFMPYEKAT